MFASAHIAPHRPRHVSTWVAGATGLVLALGWTLVPAVRIMLVAGAVVILVAAVHMLANPATRAEGPPEADSVAILADHGIRDLEAYLARHLAFEIYLETRDERAAAERPGG